MNKTPHLVHRLERPISLLEMAVSGDGGGGGSEMAAHQFPTCAQFRCNAPMHPCSSNGAPASQLWAKGAPLGGMAPPLSTLKIITE